MGIQSGFGDTPEDHLIIAFREALRRPNRKRLTELLAKGAFSAYEERDFSVICEAATFAGECGNTIRWLIEQGADPRKCDRNGDSPLSEAASGSNPDPVRAILEAGVDPDERQGDETLLHRMAANHQAEIVQVLLEFGAAANAENEKGRTPLDLTYLVMWHDHDASGTDALSTSDVLTKAGGEHGSSWRGYEEEHAEVISNRKW